jgi:hypothetical protein
LQKRCYVCNAGYDDCPGASRHWKLCPHLPREFALSLIIDAYKGVALQHVPRKFRGKFDEELRLAVVANTSGATVCGGGTAEDAASSVPWTSSAIEEEDGQYAFCVADASDIDQYGVDVATGAGMGVTTGFTPLVPVAVGVTIASSAADVGEGGWTPSVDDGVVTWAYPSGAPAHAAVASASSEGGDCVEWSYDYDWSLHGALALGSIVARVAPTSTVGARSTSLTGPTTQTTQRSGLSHSR